MRRRNLLLYSLLFIAGCASVSNTTSGSQPKKLRFTVTDALGMQELQRDYGALQVALKEILQTEIELVPVESYTAAASALQSDQLDFVLTGPSEYVVIRARTNAVPIIGITRPNYRTVVCVAANSKIKSLADLKGKKIAFWKVGSTSGYLGPTKLLMDAGLNTKSDVTILMLGSKGLPALQKGEVDAWGGSAVKYEQFLQEQGLSATSFPVIAKGPLLPKDLFVASSQVEPELVKQINSLFIANQDKIIQSLSNVEEGKYKGSTLVSIKDSEYDMVREVYKAIGQGNFVP